MMTTEQRYLFDLRGYLHIRQAFTGDELSAAQAAAERYLATPAEELPAGFELDGKRLVHGFAFDRALERLALHPSIWPIVKELCKGRPRLVSGTLQVNVPGAEDSSAMRLHCARDDYGWDAIRYDVRDSRIFCDHTVVFPYLSDVFPGDGGLLVVPGSHKSMFDRPPELFNGGTIESLDELPEGVENVTPRAATSPIPSHSAWLPRPAS